MTIFGKTWWITGNKPFCLFDIKYPILYYNLTVEEHEKLIYKNNQKSEVFKIATNSQEEKDIISKEIRGVINCIYVENENKRPPERVLINPGPNLHNEKYADLEFYITKENFKLFMDILRKLSETHNLKTIYVNYPKGNSWIIK